MSAEELALLPPSVRARLATVEDLLDVTLAHVEELNRLGVLLEARIAWPEERVGTNSSNSSKPPRSNGPNAPPASRPGPTGRPKGEQKGHKGHRRELLPPEKDTVVTCKLVACDGCGHPLADADPEPLRHQVIELPEKLAHATEYRLHELTCACYGASTRAPLPPEAPVTMLGARGQALVGALVSQFKLSHRDVVVFFASVLGVVMSPGTVARMLYRVSEAVASVEAAKKLARQQAVAHADETSWRQGRRTS